jgi:hypothetical protein
MDPVQVENLTRLPLLASPAVAELHRLLARLRWRLGCERVAQAAIRGILASSVTLVLLSLGAWLTALDRTWLWLAAAPLLASLGYALVRWPGPLESARVADRRLGLDERLATAFERSQSEPGGRFDLVQIRDAVAHASARVHPTGPRTWLALDARTRTEGGVAAAALVLAAAIVLVLATIPRPYAATAGSTADQFSLVDSSGAADTSADRALPSDDAAADQASAASPRAAATPPPADLAARVQQEQAERAALDKLAQGLGSVSAGQGAADAIQRGDFGAARDQIQSLGEEADQLSDAAKQQLARGLQQAAAASAQSDRGLADREQQAAQALSRSTYSDQRQALSALADQVQRSGSRSVPADQLERDQGQLQQQLQQRALQQQSSQAGAGQSGTAARNQTSGAAPQGASATDAGATADQGAASEGMSSGGQSDGTSGGAQQGGAGIGSGSPTDPFSNQASRLDTSGQQVEVPTRLGNGSAVRPADGTEDQSTANPSLGGQSVAEQAQAQQTGQVNPEQNLVPGEQRPVVRGYFR